eukprot:CAMPEP_0180124018 /NCGR_PEP_ID=MMETSP0986-20121125/4425_1 /TAXON_ID=697907 /ORGANISM="non described non described, Strain CCMP2293" /LENGTH=41 /DNA_ID= /DNA_START= /DNA_END= /DNA_ORIENTATION=
MSEVPLYPRPLDRATSARGRGHVTTGSRDPVVEHTRGAQTG